MLMADMSDSERQTVRQRNAFWLPEGAELLEYLTCTGAALFRMSDGSVHVKFAGDRAAGDDPIQSLDERIDRYKRALAEAERFRGIARAALGLQTEDDQPWACPSCGVHFHDSQPVCPACGAEHE